MVGFLDTAFQSFLNTAFQPAEEHHVEHHEAEERHEAGGAAHGNNLQGLICGVSAGGDKDGRIACGIPMHRDEQTGAPYIVPLYMQPPATGGGGGAAGVAGKQDAAAARLEATVSARIRQEGLELLSRFLDAAPDAKPAPAPAGVYPVPGRALPGGLQVVPDLGSLAAGASNTAGPGAFM